MSRKGRGLAPYDIESRILVGDLPDPVAEWLDEAQRRALDREDLGYITGVKAVLDALEQTPGHNCSRFHAHLGAHDGVESQQYHHHHDASCIPTYRLRPPS